MNPREIYEALSSEVDDQDVSALLRILVNHVGKENKIDRRSLVIRMYGKYTESLWRKMRMAKALLTKKRFSNGLKLSIGSSSGEGGYWLVYDEADREPCVAETGSRKAELDDAFDNIKNGMTWVDVIRMFGKDAHKEIETEFLQPALLDVEEPRDYFYNWRR